MPTNDKVFISKDETWARVADHYFLLSDRNGPNLQPRRAPSEHIVETAFDSLSESTQTVFTGLVALMDHKDVVWLYASDDELFYVTPVKTVFLVRQGNVNVLRRCELPPGARLTVLGDPALVQMTEMADDLG